MFRYVTWPLLLPITLVVLLLSTIDAFKMFQPVFLFVGPGGGPLNSARTLGLVKLYPRLEPCPLDTVLCKQSLYCHLHHCAGRHNVAAGRLCLWDDEISRPSTTLSRHSWLNYDPR